MKDFEISIENLDSIQTIPWNKIDNDRYNSVVIVPTGKIHDSGYMCMALVFCKGENVICKSTGCSDVIHIDGIGGYGNDDYVSRTSPVMVSPKAWKIDCLPNGYLRIFSRGKIINGNGLSDYDIFAEVTA